LFKQVLFAHVHRQVSIGVMCNIDFDSWLDYNWR
jgi:hypothetical protein